MLHSWEKKEEPFSFLSMIFEKYFRGNIIQKFGSKDNVSIDPKSCLFVSYRDLDPFPPPLTEQCVNIDTVRKHGRDYENKMFFAQVVNNCNLGLICLCIGRGETGILSVVILGS